MLPGNVAISEVIEQRLQHKQPFSLAYIDLNHFKQFNDLYGYASGDSVIKLLADVTVKRVRTALILSGILAAMTLWWCLKKRCGGDL